MYRESLVTAKKAKRCAWCGDMCEAGEQRWNRAYVFQGDFRADHLHPECHGAMAASDIDPDDGFEDGQYRRGMTAEESEEIIEGEWRAAEGVEDTQW